MNAMSNFQYKHGNQITIWTKYGEVTLTYIDPKKRKAEDPFSALYYDENGKWEGNYFEAALYDEKGQIIRISKAMTPRRAAAGVILEYLSLMVYSEIESIL
jgi:hypothetical protein